MNEGDKTDMDKYLKERRSLFLDIIKSHGMMDELKRYVEEKIPEIKETRLLIGKNLEFTFHEKNIHDEDDEPAVHSTMSIGGMKIDMKNGKRIGRLVIETDGDNVSIMEDTTSGLLEAVKMLEIVLSTVSKR